jgi:uncharacterized membrane protein YeaQ/YmgE (transglycosylase-associated protein family)
MAIHNHNLTDAIEGGIIGTILSVAVTSLREQIWGEMVHGISTVIWAVVGATVVYFMNKWLRKNFPDKTNESNK